jgi:hypothetical protein
MFNITKVSENRVDIEFSGIKNAQMMEIALDDLDNATRDIKDGHMMFDVIEYNLPSIDAIAVEFSRLPSMFGMMGKFSKTAVLSDILLVKMIAELQGFLIPGIEIKAFSRDERDSAEAWLDSTPQRGLKELKVDIKK